MKILFVAELRERARATQRLMALKDLGHEVIGLSSIAHTDDYNDKTTLWSRICWKLGYPLDTVQLNSKLPQLTQSLTPDLIWIEKIVTLYPSTYQMIKAISPRTKIVFYSEDDIYLRHNRSAYLTNSLAQFDLVFTTKPRNLTELPKLGAKQVSVIYQAYDRNAHQLLSLTESERSQWGADVGFVGSFEPDRAAQMLSLAKAGISVRIWGAGWETWRKQHPNLQIEQRAVYGKDFVKVINSSKINLNFLRKINRDRHTSRSLEIPACGAFMLAERTDEHQQLFEEGKEAEFFESISELLTKVNYYLINQSERESIAKAGLARSINSGYSHHDRLKVMLAQINSNS